MLGLSNSAMRAASLWKSACMSAEASSLSIFTATIVKGSQGSKPGALWDIFLERNKKSGTFTYTQVISTHLHSYPCTYTAFPRIIQRKMPVIDRMKKYLTLVNENPWGYFQHRLTLKNAYLWIIGILKYMDPMAYYPLNLWPESKFLESREHDIFIFVSSMSLKPCLVYFWFSINFCVRFSLIMKPPCQGYHEWRKGCVLCPTAKVTIGN